MKTFLLALMSGLLLAACGSAQTDPTAAPTATETPIPSATFTLVPTSTFTPLPTLTPAFSATPEATPTVTETPVQIVVEADQNAAVDPPLNFTLPDETWVYVNGTQVVQDIDSSLRLVPFTKFGGAVTGGTGYIVLLWGFPSITAGTPTENTPASLLRLDGLRYLRLAVFEPECVFGTDQTTEYAFTVGGLSADGTTFSVVDCPEETDTRGWFAGVQVDGMNFLFYAYTDPISAMDGAAREELQNILDTVEFRVSDLLRTAVPEATTSP